MMDRSEWNTTIRQLPEPHLLQTWEWGEVKSQFGWQPFHRVWYAEGQVVAAALVLEREVRLGGFGPALRMHYTPKGPLLSDWNNHSLWKRVLEDLEKFARQRAAFLLKIDPDAVPCLNFSPELPDSTAGGTLGQRLVGLEADAEVAKVGIDVGIE